MRTSHDINRSYEDWNGIPDSIGDRSLNYPDQSVKLTGMEDGAVQKPRKRNGAGRSELGHTAHLQLIIKPFGLPTVWRMERHNQ